MVFTEIKTCKTWWMIPPSGMWVKAFVIGCQMMTDPDDIDDLRCFGILPSAIPNHLYSHIFCFPAVAITQF
jgi:hypothetical protein